MLKAQQLRWGVSASCVCSLLEQPSLDLLPGILAALVGVHAKQDAQATRQAAGLLLQQVGLRLSFETLNTSAYRCSYSWSQEAMQNGLKCESQSDFPVLPAFHSKVLCSLLELKALAKWCDSSRQSSSLKSCSEVR